MDLKPIAEAAGIALGIVAGILGVYQEFERKNRKRAIVLFAAAATIFLLIIPSMVRSRDVPSTIPACSNRPCVFAEAFRFTNEYRQIEIGVKNSGGMPALNVKNRMVVVTANRNEDVNDSLNSITEEMLPAPISSSTLSPGASMTWRSGIPEMIPIGEVSALVSAIKTGTRQLYMIGQIDFDDESGVHHFPRFCQKWSGQEFVECPEVAFVKGQKP
jgi:hypothetical protein